MNVYGNEMVAELPREGSLKNVNSDGCFTFSEIASQDKQDFDAYWRVDSDHERYASNKPDASLITGNSRCIQITLTRFRSGHFRVQRQVL